MLLYFLVRDRSGGVMIDFDINKMDQEYLCQSDYDAVFVSSADGELVCVNELSIKLVSEIELFEKLLPADHPGLLQACLKTKHPLKSKCKFEDLIITWSYQFADKVLKNKFAGNEKMTGKGDGVYICAQGFSNSKTSELTEWLENKDCNNDLPEILFNKHSEIIFSNSKVTQWLDAFNLTDIKDMLPFNHDELCQVCFKQKISLTEARGVNGKTYVWTYEPSISGVKVFARDLNVTQFKIPEHKKSLHKNYNLEFSVDGSGATKCINYATYKLLDELQLKGINDIVPGRHLGLIKACQMTNTLLTEKCELENRGIVWSYHPDNSGGVVVYGYETVQ